MESNARFVKWSDGSTQLMIGKNVALDVIERPVDDDTNLVFAKLGSGVIECQARVQDRVRLQPTSETRRAFMKHQNSIKAQQAKQKEIKQVTLRKRNEGHEEEDKLKAMRLRQRREARQAARRQREEKGLTSAFLVGGSCPQTSTRTRPPCWRVASRHPCGRCRALSAPSVSVARNRRRMMTTTFPLPTRS